MSDPGNETICDIIRRWAQMRPDAPAFLSEDKAPLNYAGLARIIERIGDTLQGAKLGRGDRIAIVLSSTNFLS